MGKRERNIRRYVAIGDSITSGYSDGALHYKGQISSYPALLAKRINPEQFLQNLLPENSPGIGFNGNSRLVATKDSFSGNGYLDLSYATKTGDNSIFQRSEKFTATHNLGVPGMKSITALMTAYGNPANGEGNYNPFFYRMCADPLQSSVLSDALQLEPDFFTLFLGNNDVLAYALYGGTTDVITPSSGGEQNFEKAISTLVYSLLQHGASGVIAGIPDIAHIPFFTSISPQGLFTEHDGKHTLLNENDYVLLEIIFDPERNDLLAGKKPIPKKYILFQDEIQLIRKSISEYNRILQNLAGEYRLGFVNTDLLISKVKKERFYNPSLQKIHYSTSRIFSLDGIHLTALGQALLANEFIHVINNTQNTSFAPLQLTSHR